MNTTASPTTNSVNKPPVRLAFLLSPLVLALAWFALSPQARAVCQEGCDDLDNTFLGDDALINNIAAFNTAIGANALQNNTTGSYNVAVGKNTLLASTIGDYNTALGMSALADNTNGISKHRYRLSGDVQKHDWKR